MNFAVRINPASLDRQALYQAIADQVGTPAFVYDLDKISQHYRDYANALGDGNLLCYAVKANSNLSVLRHLVALGAGFDIVSGGELLRVVRAGGNPAKVVFSGVGKSDAEIRLALDMGIKCFNVESESELRRISRQAVDLGKVAPISIRVNPDVDAQTHPYIATGMKDNKFGIAMDQALACYTLATELSNLRIVGVDCHIGSQLTQLAPFADAFERVLALVDQLAEQGIHLNHVDMGGGLGIAYGNENLPDKASYLALFRETLAARGLQLIIEPGRSLVGDAGVLITEVLCIKDTAEKRFVVLDTAMNDNLRPALYGAKHRISVLQSGCTEPARACELVGPVCESADVIARDQKLALDEGDLLLVHDVGAYGFAMSSNYNARPRAAEVVIAGEAYTVARERESFNDMLKGETLYWNQ